MNAYSGAVNKQLANWIMKTQRLADAYLAAVAGQFLSDR